MLLTQKVRFLLPELSNHCRNLDDKEMPWCFTSETEWGYCDVSCKWMPGKIGSHQSSILMTSLLGSSFLSTKHAACQSTKVLVTNLVHVSWALEFIYTTGPTKTDPSQTCKKSIKGAEYLGTTAVTQWEFCPVFLSQQKIFETNWCPKLLMASGKVVSTKIISISLSFVAKQVWLQMPELGIWQTIWS